LPKIAAGTGNADKARKGRRSVYQPGLDTYVDYTVYDRNLLLSLDRVDGPAIIEEPSATTIIPAGDVMVVGEYGELVIEIGANQ
jgi:N-methylhydantoinase A